MKAGYDNIPQKVIYVYSGKGGVGKSTICVNLAYAMMQQGIRVGIFDGDLSGPSIPTMVRNLESHPPRFDNFRVLPGNYNNVYINSIGFISEPVEGGYWQGKYLEGLLRQMLLDTFWQDIDVLIIDMPPGVGEFHRFLFRQVPGKVVVVTTPQDLSYIDTIRAIEMMNRMKIDIIGVIENMSYYICECGLKSHIFEGDTNKLLCAPTGVNLLLQVPLNIFIVKQASEGVPFILNSQAASKIIDGFKELASKIYWNYESLRSVRPTN